MARESLNQRMVERIKRDGCCGVISPVITNIVIVSQRKQRKKVRYMHAYMEHKNYETKTVYLEISRDLITDK